MQEREDSNEVIIAKLEEKFSQLLNVVNDIKNSLTHQTEKISEVDRELMTLKIESKQRQDDIDKLKNKQEDNRKWLMGIIATLIGGIALAVVKILLGI